MSKKYTEIKNASNIAITVILFLAIISTLFLSRLSTLNSLSGFQASAQTTNVGENQVFTVVGPKI